MLVIIIGNSINDLYNVNNREIFLCAPNRCERNEAAQVHEFFEFSVRIGKIVIIFNEWK